MNNPVKLIDPNGEDIYIFGTYTSEAVKQLSNGSKGIELILREDGSLCYNINNFNRLNDYSLNLIRMIDDHSITLNITTTNNNNLTTGQYFVGGSFGGGIRFRKILKAVFQLMLIKLLIQKFLVLSMILLIRVVK